MFLPVTFVQAQGTPKPGEKVAGAGKRTDVYHVHFTKAALGKAVQLGDWLKTPNPNGPMPDHFIVLRHQDGDAWDYVVITHLGTKATVEAAGTAVPPDKRDLSAWHNDKHRRVQDRFILSLTIALLPVIASNWKRCSAKRRAGQLTQRRATC